MKPRYLTVLFSFFLGCFASPVLGQFYNGSQQEFGKNRLQYEPFLWQNFQFERFDTYFYEGGKDLAEYVSRTATIHLADMEELFDYEITEKIEFVVYNKLSDFRQSNIGLASQEDYNIGGVTRIQGNKVFLYYEGEHSGLDEQIRYGLATILVNQMMYGSNWKELIKNNTLLALPDWYLKGLVSYAAKDWDIETDNRVRDGILSGDFDKFNQLTGTDAEFAGHSIWNYIAEVYGDNVIPNILYMTRVSRNVERGFLYVVGASLRTLSLEYLSYYRKRYESDEKMRLVPKFDPLEVKTKDERSYSQFRISPDSKYAVYVSNELGQYKVWLHDLVEDKVKRVFKGEHKLNRIIDNSFPIVAWHPRAGGFAFITEGEGRVFMHIYTLETGKLSTRELFALQKVLDINYDPTGRKLVFSAVKEGQTDLYVYDVIGNRQTQLTNDPWDDRYPNYAKGGSEIIFSSNRLDDTLRTKNTIELQSPFYDVFIYNNAVKSNVLTRITSTPLTNEIFPASYDTLSYTYLSDDNGIMNRYIARYDSAIASIDTAVNYRYFTTSYPITNYSRGILEYQMLPKRGKYAMLMYRDGDYHFYIGRVAGDQVYERSDLPNTEYQSNRLFLLGDAFDEIEQENVGTSTVTTIKVFDTNEDEKVDTDHYVFSDDKTNSTGTTTAGDPLEPDTATGELVEVDDFIMPKASRYKLNFALDEVTTQFDNTYFNQNYQRFNGGAGYNNPGLNSLIKMSISDVFEDHRIVGGVRLSIDLNTNEYLLAYHDLSKRWDKTYLFHRQSLRNIGNGAVNSVVTNEVKYITKYPFSEVAAIRATLNVRHDRSVALSTDQNTLRTPNIYNNIGSAKLEYIFDNTLPIALNILNGTRAKVWAEYYQEFDRSGSDFKVVGFDIRHYQKLHRTLTLTARLAGSTSFGSEKLVYYMGGVDNWIGANFDYSIPIASDQGYAYQAIATPMRGFFQNARNGNSFAVANTEIRWPVFNYLLNRPINSDFIQNFQLIGFGDVGTAFTGSDPYSEDNTFNIQSIVQNPLTITIQNQREPIIYGYGFGLRSRLWGYFIRADWAWGVDDGVILDPVFYLSLSLDF